MDINERRQLLDPILSSLISLRKSEGNDLCVTIILYTYYYYSRLFTIPSF